MKLLHAMIRVRDIEQSLKFYTGLLEMKVAKEMRLEDCTLYFLSDRHGEVQIELTANDNTPDEGYDLGKGFGHFAFSVTSMEEFTHRLNEFGYEYLYEPYKLHGYNMTIAFVKDPDGYEIELIEG